MVEFDFVAEYVRVRVRGDELRRPDGFGFTGEPTERPPLPDEAVSARRRVGNHVEDSARTWTAEHRQETRRLQATGVSWAQIAVRVCGDARYKPTVMGAAVGGRGPLVA